MTSNSSKYAWLAYHVTGLLLLFAAAAKLLAENSIDAPSFGGVFLGVIILQVEITLGALLVSLTYIQIVWPCAVLLYTCFAAYSLFQINAGETHCGCFGDLRLDPFYSLSLDVASILILLWARRGRVPLDNWKRTTGFTVVTSFMTVWHIWSILSLKGGLQ